MPGLVELSNLTEQLVSTAVLVDPLDLTSLAELHTRLQAVSRFANAASVEARAAMGESIDYMQGVATTAEKLVEQIVLSEVSDADAALADVNQAISQLQGLVRGMTEGTRAASDSPLPQVITDSELAAAATVEATVPDTANATEVQIEIENPINNDDLPLIADFVTEANSHLETAEAELLRLEADPRNTDIVAAVFRSFHTIKGVAGFLNLKQIGALAHAAENLLDLARHGKLELSGNRCDLVLEALDSMKFLVKSLADTVKHGTRLPTIGELPALLVRLHACAAGVIVASTHGRNATAATKPVAASTISPAINLAEPTAKPLEVPAVSNTLVQVYASAHGPGAAKNGPHQAEATVKVATDRLDSLINMVGELVIAQSMVSQDTANATAGNQRLARNMAHLGKITRELQDLSMSMRMVPVAGVFQKMARLVRDTARKFDKEIDFVVTGGETELDRNVVEAIGDPLVHMVRNSVDHGIELPADRLKAGKPRAGRIELRAFHQAGNIVIEITDDGKGLNKARLIKKATEAGIIKEGHELSEQEVFKLIFHAGLSTAEKVTDVSGRGVGMDVVKKNVEALRGRIDISSVEGKGSVFSIRLPLTLAVIDGLVVRVGRERYILPLTSVEQSIQPTAGQISTLHGRCEMLMVREQLVPMFRLYQLFSVKPTCEDPTAALVVIVLSEDRRCGLMVDELIGQQQVVIKSLGASLGPVDGVSGGAILGDGNISLILDVPGLIALANR